MRRRPKRSAAAARSSPPLSADSTVDALAELAPFSKALASVATREEPEQPDAPPELVAAAYVMRATWLALHRGDAAELHEMAKAAIDYLQTETTGVETIVCKMFALPPIKNLNRAEAGRELLAYAELALKSRSTAPEIAQSMQHAIEHTFPSLIPSWKSSEAAKLERTIERDHRLKKLAPRKLVTLVLRALGMADTEIASVIKSSENRP